MEAVKRIKELSEKIKTLDRGYDHAINDEVSNTMRENIDLITEAETNYLKLRNKEYFEANPDKLEGSAQEHIDFIFSQYHDNASYKKYRYLSEKVQEYVSFLNKRISTKIRKDNALKAEREVYI